MIYNACLVVGIIFIFIGGILFLGYGIAGATCLDMEYLCVAVVGVIILLFGIWGVSIYNKHAEIPEVIKYLV